MSKRTSKSGHTDEAFPPPPPPTEQPPELVPPDISDLKPSISMSLPLGEMIQISHASIRARNDKKPSIYRQNLKLVQIHSDNAGEPQVCQFCEDSAINLLDRTASWERTGRNGEKILCMPPKQVAKDMLCNQNLHFPLLDQIVHCPVFSMSGQLIEKSGYNEASRSYLHLKNLELIPVPSEPTTEDVAEALKFIFEDAMGEFPFVDQASRANSLAAMLLLFGREMISGCTPLHLITSPSPGTGKGKLAHLIAYPAKGSPLSGSTVPADGPEMRRFFFSTVARGECAIFLDNIEANLGGAALASTLTSPVITDRVVGSSLSPSFRNRALWLATGNNVAVSTGEIGRRVIRIKLDSNQECAWKDRFFKHDVTNWSMQKPIRSKLVWACCLLWRNWIAKGLPIVDGLSVGSFEEWSKVMRSVLAAANVEGFLENFHETCENSAEEENPMAHLVPIWWEKHGNDPILSGQLIPLIEEHDINFPFMQFDKVRQKQKWGNEIRRHVDRIYGGFKILKHGTEHSGRALYRLREHVPTPVPSEYLPDGMTKIPDLFDALTDALSDARAESPVDFL